VSERNEDLVLGACGFFAWVCVLCFLLCVVFVLVCVKVLISVFLC